MASTLLLVLNYVSALIISIASSMGQLYSLSNMMDEQRPFDVAEADDKVMNLIFNCSFIGYAFSTIFSLATLAWPSFAINGSAFFMWIARLASGASRYRHEYVMFSSDAATRRQHKRFSGFAIVLCGLGTVANLFMIILTLVQAARA